MIRRAAGLGALSGRHDARRLREGLRLLRPAGDRRRARGADGGADRGAGGGRRDPGRRGRAPAGGCWPRPRRSAGSRGTTGRRGGWRELAAMPNVRRDDAHHRHRRLRPGHLRRAGAGGASPGDRGDAPLECFWRIVREARGAGARARWSGPSPSADNDRPGVMHGGRGAGLSQPLGRGAGQAVAVFGNNDDAHRTARDLAAAGLRRGGA